MKKNVLIIGAGGVARVVAHEIVRYSEEFGSISIASRGIEKIEKIIHSVANLQGDEKAKKISTFSLNALDIEQTTKLINKLNAKIVINVGSAFINISVLRACIETGAAYLDTAIHEQPNKICETPPWYANYEWKHKKQAKESGVTAILGVGFDPGVVNAYAKLTTKIFDKINSIDILDVNAGNHGKYFATNFDPEINFREFTGIVYSWQNSSWQTNDMFEIQRTDNLPAVGTQVLYMTGHDEIHSMSQNLDIPNIRFWMSFSEHYRTIFTVLKNLGLLSEQPVTTAEGLEVVPLKVVKAILPDPASLAINYTGETCIGNVTRGIRNGEEQELFIYNITVHETSYKLTESQGISYTAGLPPTAAARLIAKGSWDVKEMRNVEELEPEEFLSLLDDMGLKTRIKQGDLDLPWREFMSKL